MELSLAQPRTGGRALPADRLLPAIAIAGMVTIAALRLSILPGLPLWLDETWTAMIASQPSWSAFWREAWLDCNPPLYYVFMAIWTKFAGISNEALRAPSFLFMAAAAAAGYWWKLRGLSREARIAWAALLFIWWPGVVLSLDARGYGLLFLLSVAQTIAYASLLQAPSTRRAACWAALSSAAALTHYHALLPAAVQGLLYLAGYRMQAVRTWPAALAFVPAFGWLAYQLPRLADYARPDVAWYPTVQLGDVVSNLIYVTGASTLKLLVCALMGILSLIAIRLRDGAVEEAEPLSGSRHLWLTAASGLIALVLAWAIGAFRPMLTERYLTPLVPLILLGIVLIVRHVRGTPGAYLALVAIYFLGSATPTSLTQRMNKRNVYGYQTASEFVMAAQPDRLIFTWDHPAAKILDRGSLRQIGELFFERAGHPVETVAVVLDKDQDPNRAMLANARSGRPALIWLYNTSRASAAKNFPPRLDRAPGWRCRHDRHGPIGVIACAPERLFPRSPT